RPPHSFPTRRSSDLVDQLERVVGPTRIADDHRQRANADRFYQALLVRRHWRSVAEDGSAANLSTVKPVPPKLRAVQNSPLDSGKDRKSTRLNSSHSQ